MAQVGSRIFELVVMEELPFYGVSMLGVRPGITTLLLWATTYSLLTEGAMAPVRVEEIQPSKLHSRSGDLAGFS
jgi:hypothetical protein